MYRSLALKLSCSVCRPTLHSHKQLLTMARKSLDQNRRFASSQQLLIGKEILIPNKEISQEIDGIHDLDQTDVKHELEAPDSEWIAAVKDLCKKLDLTYDQFCKMYTVAPLLKYVETVQHLSEIVDVLTDYGYGSSVRGLVTKCVNRFSVISVECLRSTLEEHGRDILKKMLLPSNTKQPEILHRKLKYPLTAKAIEHSISSEGNSIIDRNVSFNFPFQKLTENGKSYKSIAEFLGDELGIDQRVVSAVYPCVFRKNYFWLDRARVAVLQKEGVETYDILENLPFVIHQSNYHFMKRAEEMCKVGIEKFLESTYLSYTKGLMTKTLSRLFYSTRSSKDLEREEVEFFYGKGKLNAAAVFYLLMDEGFNKKEIRKFIFLLGVPENEIRQYLRDNNMRSLMVENESWKLLQKMKDDLIN